MALRLGLCCLFVNEPIRFRTTTATALLRMPRDAVLRKVSDICRENAIALQAAITFCGRHGIGCFRINSQILPVKTHPDAGYAVTELPGYKDIRGLFVRCSTLAQSLDVRLTFHPDQFVVLNSPDPGVVARSLADLAYHAQVAEWVGADCINIHAGGVYGDKLAALARLVKTIRRMPERIRRLLTIENDDRSFTPSDLLPVARATGVPLTYDVHHHRCLPDGLTVEEATDEAVATWNREPLMHLSSPKYGWSGPDPRPHHDYIDLADFPVSWRGRSFTIEVEAKAKEIAVLRLKTQLGG